MTNDTNIRRTDAENVLRLLARVFVIAGGAFWVIAAFAGPYVFGETSLAESVKSAMWPFLAAVVILVIGWTYEHLAAVLLFAASAAAIVWGVIYGWEPGVWLVMSFVLIAPTGIAGVLFLLAARAEAKRTLAAEERSDEERRSAARGIQSSHPQARLP